MTTQQQSRPVCSSAAGRQREARHDEGTRHILGSLALLLGVVIVCLSFARDTTGLPVRFPATFYRHAVLWYGLGFACLIIGGTLQYRRRASHGWSPTRGGRRFESVVLYTRSTCPLCQDARDVLRDHDTWLPPLIEVDIDSDPHLIEQYGTCVPVVVIDDTVRFRGKVNDVLLRRLIEGTPPSALQ